MSIRRPKCDGHIRRYGVDHVCSNVAAFAVSPDGASNWKGACGHHLAPLVVEMSGQHGARFTVIHLGRPRAGS